MRKPSIVIFGLLVLALGSISCTSAEETTTPSVATPLEEKSTVSEASLPEDTSSPDDTAPSEEITLSEEATSPQETVPSQDDTVTSPSASTPPSVEEQERTFSVGEVVVMLEPTVVRIEIPEGSGSGVIISRTGYVLTNNHVVEDAHRITITLVSGEEYDGIVIARDEHRDLAIVGIIAGRTDFSEAVLGSSEDMIVGEDVIAIGYALGFEGQVTISKGIISAIREMDGDNYIQTDAAINPGSSGGPLVNLRGEIMGINTAKYVGEAVESIGLAIPINEVKLFIENTIGW